MPLGQLLRRASAALGVLVVLALGAGLIQVRTPPFGASPSGAQLTSHDH